MFSFTNRSPRFTRKVEAVPVFQMVDRDIEILRQVAMHRFLRSSHIVKLVGGSPQQVLRRLQLLFHHGYLYRPRCQLDYFHQGGSRTMVYGLASRGAGLLRQRLNMPFEKMEWSGKAQKVGRLFLDHALLVSKVMVAIELACRATPSQHFLSLEDLPLVDSMRSGRAALRWTVMLSAKEKIGVIPDGFFGIETTNAAGQRSRSYFFLEADRGTMPVMRRGIAQSSFHRRLLAYEATWEQNLHKEKLCLHRFRVLTVTNSPQRAEHLVEAARLLPRGQGLFLFTDAASLAAAEDIFTHPWKTPREGVTDTLG